MSCGAVLGTTILGVAALPLATAIPRGFASTGSVFELSVSRRGLCSPLALLPSCPFPEFFVRTVVRIYCLRGIANLVPPIDLPPVEKIPKS